MSAAVFFLLVLGSSLAANVLVFVPVAAWWRNIFNRRAATSAAGAFQLLFGHVAALRGRAIVFHSNGEVSMHDARAFLRATVSAAVPRSGGSPGGMAFIRPVTGDEAPPASDLRRQLEDVAAPASRGQAGDEAPITSRGAS